MQEITLANGGRVPDVVIAATMLNLRECLEDRPLAFYDLVMVCREPGYVPFGDNAQRLRALGLLQPDGRPHEAVRDVVLSAVTGDGAAMTLGDPFAQDGPPEYDPDDGEAQRIAEVFADARAEMDRGL